MKKTAELVLDEFEKVEAIEKKRGRGAREGRGAQKELLAATAPDD
jgi:hypothetical protein